MSEVMTSAKEGGRIRIKSSNWSRTDVEPSCPGPNLLQADSREWIVTLRHHAIMKCWAHSRQCNRRCNCMKQVLGDLHLSLWRWVMLSAFLVQHLARQWCSQAQQLARRGSTSAQQLAQSISGAAVFGAAVSQKKNSLDLLFLFS